MGTQIMNVIGREAFRRFTAIHPAAVAALDHWHRVARRAAWGNLVEVRQDSSRRVGGQV
jgi:mRNA-degrading endonuclease HigB of HigAB toxin-antitoxin module